MHMIEGISHLTFVVGFGARLNVLQIDFRCGRGIFKWRQDIKRPRPRLSGEGQSLYSYDFDNHLFELHTGSHKTRLDAYLE